VHSVARSVILLPIAITFYTTWWFIRFVDGFFSPIYIHVGINGFGIYANSIGTYAYGSVSGGFSVGFSKIDDGRFHFVRAGLGFATSITFIFLVGVFMSSWLGTSLLGLGEFVIKKMPLVRHIYSASKQISAAISPGMIRSFTA
jgi:uncharacterized membrane protein